MTNQHGVYDLLTSFIIIGLSMGYTLKVPCVKFLSVPQAMMIITDFQGHRRKTVLYNITLKSRPFFILHFCLQISRLQISSAHIWKSQSRNLELFSLFFPGYNSELGDFILFF